MNGHNAVEEAEANYFVMCLLMPREFVVREVQAMGGIDVGDDQAIAALARKFGVQQTVMAMRLGQLWSVGPRA